MKKTALVIFLYVVLVCSGCKGNSDAYKNTAIVFERGEEEKTYVNSTDAPENIKQFFDKLTDDMLNAVEMCSSLDSYWNDSLVLLKQFNNNIRLYGINVDGQTAMILYIKGEKILIEEDPYPSFQNLYQESPKLNVYDVDSDGEDEALISLRTVTGTISRYAMLVCDQEDEWNIYMYSDYLKDIDAELEYKYDDKNSLFTFLDNKGNVLWEGQLPEWSDRYAYTGVVNWGDNMEFDADTFQMYVVPQIELENSLPYEPIRITFNLCFDNGNYKIAGYIIDTYRLAEDSSV